MSELYRLIHAEKATYPIVLLCRVLKVARSSYYAWSEGEAARRARQAADDALAHEITVLHIASRNTYGVPRIHDGQRGLLSRHEGPGDQSRRDRPLHRAAAGAVRHPDSPPRRHRLSNPTEGSQRHFNGSLVPRSNQGAAPSGTAPSSCPSLIRPPWRRCAPCENTTTGSRHRSGR